MPEFQSILTAFLTHAQNDPERPCILWEGSSISYGRLAGAALDWADHYAGSRVCRGDRVGLYMGNSPDFLAAYLGAHAAGAAVVLMNNQYRQHELQHILRDSEPRVVVTDEPGAELLAGVLPELEKKPEVVPVSSLSKGVTTDDRRPTTAGQGRSSHPAPGTNFQIAELKTSDLAILAYTSGTTGRSKGAMLTHGNLVANSAAVTRAWRWTAQDRLLLLLPLFHIHGLGVGVHGTLLSGASLELHARFDPAIALERFASGTISMFFGVPTMYGRICEEARQSGGETRWRPVGERMRLFVSGSAALSPQTFDEFARLFGQGILERYGMSETVMNLTNPYDGERRPGTVGMPFPGQEARIVDPRTRESLPAGEVGEIQVRGPHVCAGYWRNPEATGEVFGADGWFSTGDLGQVSADGYFTITGRAKELIISGGYNIYPREVEEVLLDHPAVAECAVLGLPDSDMGEQVVAVVVLKEGLPAPTADELVAICRERLAAYKRPRRIIFSEGLPRNAMGKVEKVRLREILSDKVTR